MLARRADSSPNFVAFPVRITTPMPVPLTTLVPMKAILLVSAVTSPWPSGAGSETFSAGNDSPTSDA